tara:strand:- start:506 stop:850 length:345 start_codon:yes stop_codon:yes gene_type:complete
MKNILLVIIILMIQSCTNGSKKSTKDIISSQDMIKILTQRHILVSELNTFQYQGDTNKNHIDSLLSNCYLSLGYSDNDFDKSWNYYISDANEELLIIYDQVLQELEIIQQKSKN